MVRSYLTPWIPEGKPTYEEVFWAREGGLVLPVVILGVLASDARSTVWLAVGFVGYFCTLVDNRRPEERQDDDTGYTPPGAFGVATALVVGIAVLSAPTVESQVAAATSLAPPIVTTVGDAIGSADVAVLTVGGITGRFARTAYRWHRADDVRPPA